jgi:imidazolonepropionase-like amidohydrolase
LRNAQLVARATNRLIAALCGLITVLAACAPTPAVTERTSPSVAIVGVTIIDVRTGSHIPHMTVLVRGGRIERVGRGVAVPRGAVTVSGTGKYLIPGLWDMHAHHQASGEESLELFLANGVVGTRDMGGDMDFILPLRERIRRGETRGPEIVAAGPILDAAPSAWPLRRRVANAAEARTAVRELAAANVDLIKVHDHTPREAFFAILEAARGAGLPVAGHVPNHVTVAEAVGAGMQSIEHLANLRVHLECSGGVAYDPARCRPLYEDMARRRVWQVPTLTFFQQIPDLFSGTPPPHYEYSSPTLRAFWAANEAESELTPEALGFLRSGNAQAIAAIRDMHAAGVPFLAGCDGMVPGFCLHDELARLVRAGFSPAEALRTATLNPAIFLGREASQGVIEVGKEADLVLLDADPLLDIRNTRRIAAVIHDGRLLTRNAIAELLEARRQR